MVKVLTLLSKFHHILQRNLISCKYFVEMEHIFRRLYKTFSKEYRHTMAIPVGTENQSFSLYVDLLGGTTRFSEIKNCFGLQERMVEELGSQNECHLFLIFGGSGQGKTTFALALAKYYWSQIVTEKATSLHFKSNDDSLILPIYIPLGYVKENWTQVLQTFLLKKGILNEAFDKIIRRRNVLLLLDGYSEIIRRDSGTTY